MLPIEQDPSCARTFSIVLALTVFAIDAGRDVEGEDTRGAGALGTSSTSIAVAMGAVALFAYLFGDQAYDIALASGATKAPLEVHRQLGTLTAMRWRPGQA